MPSRYLLFFFGMWTIGAAALAIFYEPSLYLWMLPGAVMVAVVYVLEPQINWWYWQWSPPELKGLARRLLETQSGYYQRLDATAGREFRRRVFLLMEGSNFMPQGFEEVPLDVKLIIAATVAEMNMGQRDFLFPDFENIVLYQHPFPSPQYPDLLHASETYIPDGVLIFCTEHVRRGFVHPRLYLSLVFYEYAKVFRHARSERPLPQADLYDWEIVTDVAGFSQQAIRSWVGLEEIDLFAVVTTLFFTHADRFLEKYPALYQQFVQYFGQNPLLPPRAASG